MAKPVIRQIAPKKRLLQKASPEDSKPLKFTNTPKEDPKDPNPTAQACPIREEAVATIGLNPRPTNKRAETAIGVPKPVTPCTKVVNAHPTTNNCKSLSPPVKLVNLSAITSKPFTLSTILKRVIAPQIINKINTVVHSPFKEAREINLKLPPKTKKEITEAKIQVKEPALPPLQCINIIKTKIDITGISAINHWIIFTFSNILSSL